MLRWRSPMASVVLFLMGVVLCAMGVWRDSMPAKAGSGGASGGALTLASGIRPSSDREQFRPRPTAWVLEHADRLTNHIGAARLLEEAGFEVLPLPLDRSPWELSGMIFIGSFASEHPRYAQYMEEYEDDLVDFVAQGNVLVQLPQSERAESAPSFLPRTLRTRRNDEELEHIYVTAANHPLLEGVPLAGDGRIDARGRRAVWNGFVGQFGFEVILACDRFAQFPALMEGAHGNGRFILSSMAFDKVDLPPAPEAPDQPTQPAAVSAPPAIGVDWTEFNRAFFANLRRHVAQVCGRTAPVPVVTPTRIGGGFMRDSWMLAVLPDTQVYSLRMPGIFHIQTDWIAQNAQRLDIRYVLHLGDITDHNTPAEWANARRAMRRLDGVVPYALAAGNHDYGPHGDATTRETLMNRFFSFKEQSKLGGFAGAMEPGKLDNTFHLFEAGERKWIVIALEWGPRDAAVAWANAVMAQHTDRVGILITHAYMNNNDLRYDHTDQDNPQHWNPHEYRTPGGVNDGEELWQKLVRKHNFALVLNGHVLDDGTGYLASRNDTGTTTHQMLSNYQMRNMGGDGYLRLLEFLPGGQTVRVRTYSPLYDKYMLLPDQHFEFRLDQPVPLTSSP